MASLNPSLGTSKMGLENRRFGRKKAKKRSGERQDEPESFLSSREVDKHFLEIVKNNRGIDKNWIEFAINSRKN